MRDTTPVADVGSIAAVTTAEVITVVVDGDGVSLAPAEDLTIANVVSLAPAEDLYREHAVLRRLLIVFDSLPDPHTILRAARLFERFGAKYHAKSEERFIFPLFERTRYRSLVRHLKREHRIADDYVWQIKQSVRAGSIASLRKLLPRFTDMYREHAAHEDIELFANLPNILTDTQLESLGERMERFERKTLGANGFRRAVNELFSIEGAT